MANEATLPAAVWEGTFTIFGVPVKCAVLDDGRRIIDAEAVALLLNPESPVGEAGDLNEFIAWQCGK